jgi:hypothetical protein
MLMFLLACVDSALTTAPPTDGPRRPTPAGEEVVHEHIGRGTRFPDPLAGAPFEPETTADDGPLPAGDTFLFGEPILDLQLDLSDRAEQHLRDAPETDVAARLSLEGQQWDVEVHLKGRTSFRGIDNKPSMVIDAGGLVEGGSIAGRRRFVLQNMVQDGSMMKEHVVYELARAAGVPASQHGYANVTINGRKRGLYGVIEATDEQFLALRFADNDGNLYQGGWGADLRPGREDDFELQEPGAGREPFDDLIELVEVIERSADVNEALAACFDATTSLRTLALELVTGQADGYVRYANNYLLYGEPDAGSPCGGARWSFLPWAPDQAFRVDYVLPDGAAGRLAHLCVTDSRCRERLQIELRAVMDVWARIDVPERARAVRDRIAEACERDPFRESRCASKQDGVLEWLDGRAAVVERELTR